MIDFQSRHGSVAVSCLNTNHLWNSCLFLPRRDNVDWLTVMLENKQAFIVIDLWQDRIKQKFYWLSRRILEKT